MVCSIYDTNSPLHCCGSSSRMPCDSWGGLAKFLSHHSQLKRPTRVISKGLETYLRCRRSFHNPRKLLAKPLQQREIRVRLLRYQWQGDQNRRHHLAI
ncbi:unnamed protein product [Cuscuta campestris]|uniref:Uncharacterized protein n=1 Tax=Cuscuta campestris TaxID=132261 RepID=A0A484LKM2_9ASTE|nr:unnamed protein product [Cuscuta campestris]